MLINFRIRLARGLFKLSTKLAPEPEATEAYKSLPEELKQPMDGVAEVDGPPEQWRPEQHGNVIIVEPELMNKYRRGKL